MNTLYNISIIGYNHIFEGSDLEDSSLCYKDDDIEVIITADGHGGKQYIRSKEGSYFACQSLLEAFKEINKSNIDLDNFDTNSIKRRVYDIWLNKVIEDARLSHFRKHEIKYLFRSQYFKLLDNPVLAYGTTLNGACIIKNKLITVSIGDGGLFILKDNELIDLQDEDENETIANYTTSLSMKNAVDYIHANIHELTDFDLLFSVTDGVMNPYQTLSNFKESFVLPTLISFKEDIDGAKKGLKNFMKKLGTEIGIGDDVSIAIMYHSKDEEIDNKEPINEGDEINDARREYSENKGESERVQKAELFDVSINS